jgi:glycosyltransferase involved in cell wall biosynthesis
MVKSENPVILIITPSLNPLDNISGISSVSRLLVQEVKEYQYLPFIVGKKDTKRRGLSWLLNLASTFIRLCRIKHVDLIHFNLGLEPRSLIRDVFLYRVLLVKRIPVVLHIHGGRYMNRQSGIFGYFISFFLQKANVVIVLSKKEKSFLLANYPKTNGRKIEVIPNAIVMPGISIEEKDFQSDLSILFLGRIDQAKGLGKIATALKGLKEKGIPFTFRLCGVGPGKDWFMHQLSPGLHDCIQDMGLVSGARKQLALRASHIYLLPSDFEGLPFSLLESMANYVVPMVSPVGSMPLAVNERNGRLVSSADEIVKAVCELNADRGLLRSLSEMSRKTVEAEYSVSQFTDRIKAVYQAVGSGKASVRR